MHIHPTLPYADGICFDDIEGFDIDRAERALTAGTIPLLARFHMLSCPPTAGMAARLPAGCSRRSRPNLCDLTRLRWLQENYAFNRMEGRMLIIVGPARRPGRTTAIYDHPLSHNHLSIDPDGALTLTIDASGIRDHKSRYRYCIRLAPDEVRGLVGLNSIQN